MWPSQNSKSVPPHLYTCTHKRIYEIQTAAVLSPMIYSYNLTKNNFGSRIYKCLFCLIRSSQMVFIPMLDLLRRLSSYPPVFFVCYIDFILQRLITTIFPAFILCSAMPDVQCLSSSYSLLMFFYLYWQWKLVLLFIFLAVTAWDGIDTVLLSFLIRRDWFRSAMSKGLNCFWIPSWHCMDHREYESF